MAGYLCPMPLASSLLTAQRHPFLANRPLYAAQRHPFFANYPCLIPNGVSVCGNKKTAD